LALKTLPSTWREREAARWKEDETGGGEVARWREAGGGEVEGGGDGGGREPDGSGGDGG
jgi:hypothetical protein